jgi:hypothetical protein
MLVATQAEIKTQNHKRQNGTPEGKAQDVAYAMSGDARAGVIGGFHDRHFTLVGSIHSRSSFNVPTGPRRG